MLRQILRKTVLMAGALAFFFGIVWMLQSTGSLSDDGWISRDPRLFTPGIVLTIIGALSIFAARRI